MTGRHYPEEVKQYARKRRMAGDALNEVVRKIYARTGRLPAHKTVMAWCASLPPFRASKQLWAERWKRRAMEIGRAHV